MSEYNNLKDVLIHYNENHDPKTGQFTSDQTGGSSKENKQQGSGKQGGGKSTTVKVLEESGKISKTIADFRTEPGKTIYKDYSDMSTSEIDSVINRLKKEHELSNLQQKTKYIKSGSEKRRELFQTISGIISVGTSVALIYGALFKKNNS